MRARNITVAVSRSSLHEQRDEVTYWLTRPGEERISAVEVMRRRVFWS